MSTNINPAGFITPFSVWGVHNNLLFVIEQMLAKVQTATIVKVMSCTNDGDVSPVGTVSVQNLVNQVNSAGISTPHVEMYDLPYLRMQGGSNAVIMDPVPGDIGIALFCSRDITNVVNTKAQANPATFRMHDFSDGIYLGGILNQAPSQYIQFSSSGIEIYSPGTITLQAPNIVIDGALQQQNGNVTMSQNLTVTEDATASGISLKTHVHSGVQTGSENTGEPVS